MQKKPIKSLSVQPLETARHDYEGWETFAIRTEPGNVCVAIVGEVDNYHDTEYRELAYQMAAGPELFEALRQLSNLTAYPAHETENIAWAYDKIREDARALITRLSPTQI